MGNKKEIERLALIIGAQKAGTTPLFHFLPHHGSINPARKKEIGFFSKKRLYEKGSTWYAQQFHKDVQKINIEADPSYLYYPEAIPNIKKLFSNAQLIIVLRNPIQRAFSAYNMYRQLCQISWIEQNKLRWKHSTHFWNNKSSVIQNKLFNEIFTFDQKFDSFDTLVRKALAENEKRLSLHGQIIDRGIYIHQIDRVLQYFDVSQVLIVEHKSLYENTTLELSRIEKFLKIPSFDWSGLANKKVHKRIYTENLKETTKSRLYNFYKPYNEDLLKYFGVNYL